MIKLSERFVAWLLLNVVRNDSDYTRPGGPRILEGLVLCAPYSPFY
jgi:hypothetical protein